VTADVWIALLLAMPLIFPIPLTQHHWCHEKRC
jgi:hypothetical protein